MAGAARLARDAPPSLRELTLSVPKLPAALVAALAARGIAAGAVTVSWRPDRTDTAMHHGGAGLQDLAQLRIGG